MDFNHFNDDVTFVRDKMTISKLLLTSLASFPKTEDCKPAKCIKHGIIVPGIRVS